MGRIAISGESNKLTVIRRSDPPRDKNGNPLYDVKCGWCGRIKTMRKWVIHCSQSCGCARKQLIGKANTKHGATGSGNRAPEYRAWSVAKNRCCNANNKDYHNYGERGIKMCREWLHDYPAFLEHIGPRPTQPEGKIEYSLDRINNDGNYEPGNVRWAVMKQQSRNRRNNRIIKFNGEALCVTEWAERLGINTSTLFMRLEDGWTVERALTQPLQPQNHSRKIPANA